MNYNYVLSAVRDEKDFVENVKQASLKMFDENPKLETLLSKKGREIKAYRDDEDMLIYIFDKEKNKLTIHKEEIHSFNKKESIKKILYWDNRNTKDGKVQLFLPTVFSFNLAKNKRAGKSNVEEILKELEGLAGIGQIIIDELKETYGDDYKNNPAFLDSLNEPESNLEKCAYNASILQAYSNFLNENNYMSTKYDVSFFEHLNRDACSVMTSRLPNLLAEMNFMVQMCKKHKFKSRKTAFEFNDLDNHVWLDKDKLTITDQNCGFYFDIIDDHNFTVYFLDKEYQDVTKEIKRINTSLADGTLNPLRDIALKVKDGVAVACNWAYMYSFELDMEFSVKAVEEAELGLRKFDVDIQSYEYLKNYYYDRFGYSEFEFLAQAFMTLGGGFDYDKEKGAFIYSSAKYIKNLSAAPDTRQEKHEKFNYCLPKSVSYLNEEWLDGLKYMVSVLKNDKPIPVVFNGEDPKKAVEEAATFFENIIAQLEQKTTKPRI